MIAMSERTRVRILGGGFGGLYAALQFEKRCDTQFEVTVVNRENFFLFTPMLHEIAASVLDLTNIVNPVRKMDQRALATSQTKTGARRRGIITNFLNQLETMIASHHEEPVEVPSTLEKWMTGTSVCMNGGEIKPFKEIRK